MNRFLRAVVAIGCVSAARAAEELSFTGKPSEGVQTPVPEAKVFTASIWAKANDAGGEGRPYPRLFQLPGGYLHMARNEGNAGAGDLILGLNVPKEVVPRGVSAWTFGGAMPLGRWAHVAVICRTDSAAVPEIYVNGARVKTRAKAKPLTAAFKGGMATLGNAGPGGQRAFDGLLAHFRFEPRALAPAEIAEMARAAPDGKPPETPKPVYSDLLPLVDISREWGRHTVLASGADGVYQGHPTTVIAPGGTIFCVWTINHGGKCGPMAKSTDGGKTWARCDDIMPPEYKEHANCPTLQRIVRKDGGVNLAIFSSRKGGGGIMISEDGGTTWKEAPLADLSSGMPPTGLVTLKDGNAALFGQIRSNPKVHTDRASDDQSVWMSVSGDGGWTWSPMRIVATADKKNLCEPFCLRSPDGGELCLLMRENRHKGRSMMCFSRDEGHTWSAPEDTPWGLSGDRHEGIYLPDGRIFVAFRDRAIGSSTYGQYVAWVGAYADMRAGKPGDLRVHILEHVGENAWDTGYSGVELLPDGEILCTTYLHYRPDDKAHSVVSTRVRMEDLTR